MNFDANLNQYSASVTHVAEIVKPLGSMGIVGLFYMRIYSDGSVINLANCPDWTDFYFQQLQAGAYDKADISNQLFIHEGISLWALNPENQVWREGRDKFGYGQGVTLCEEHEGFREVISFYARADNDAINHFYINHTDQLKKLKQYFVAEASELIQEVENKKNARSPLILLENHTRSNESKVITPVVLDERQTVCVLHKNTHLPIQLSAQQGRCLVYLTQGKSSKEIAGAMGLSPRTVDYYLDIIRKQLGCRSSKDLIFSYADQLA